MMGFIRIQNKLISLSKLEMKLEHILHLRAEGFSQQEVAEKIGIDRTFISRLESIGEVRKGQSIACIGFPVQNKLEVESILRSFGIEYSLIMTEAERLEFINNCSGKELLNEIMDIIMQLRQYDTVIVLGSDQRISMIQGILSQEVIAIELGISPLTEDKWVDPHKLKELLKTLNLARRC
jgi:transcriptional regulator with XRE-family HTH domain